jgi:hypothetical protein
MSFRVLCSQFVSKCVREKYVNSSSSIWELIGPSRETSFNNGLFEKCVTFKNLLKKVFEKFNKWKYFHFSKIFLIFFKKIPKTIKVTHHPCSLPQFIHIMIFMLLCLYLILLHQIYAIFILYSSQHKFISLCLDFEIFLNGHGVTLSTHFDDLWSFLDDWLHFMSTYEGRAIFHR